METGVIAAERNFHVRVCKSPQVRVSSESV
jgi:hypothetical protein